MSKIVLTTLVSSICLASCTTLLVPKYQNVKVTMPTPESKLYCNDSLIGSGKTLSIRVRRSSDIPQLRIESEGYRDINATITARKLNYTPLLIIPVFAAAGIPLARLSEEDQGTPPALVVGLAAGGGIAAAALEMGSSRIKGYKPIVFDASKRVPKVVRKAQQKKLLVEQVALNLSKGAFTLISTLDGKPIKSKPTTNLVWDSVNIENTIFAQRLNYELVKSNFIDTINNSLFESAAHQLMLRAEVVKITVTEDRTDFAYKQYGYQSVAQEQEQSVLTTKWQIVDGYGVVKFDTTITSASGMFAARPDTSKTNRHTLALRNTINDALGVSMHTLLASDKAQQLLTSTDGMLDTPKDILTISRPTNAPADLEEAITTCVTIAVRTSKGQKGHGSGFFISQDGYIVTNYHVVADASSMEVINSDGKKFTATLIRSNKIADLALLKVDATLPFAFTLPTAKNYNTGMDVYAIGTPSSQELGQTISKGIVSGDRKGDAGNDIIQTDVSVSSGNSGGVLLSKEIGLIGVVNAKLVGIGVEGIAFAIPAKDIATLLNIKLQ